MTTPNNEERMKDIRERRAEAAAVTAKHGWLKAQVPTWADIDLLLSLLDSVTTERDAVLKRQNADSEKVDNSVSQGEEKREDGNWRYRNERAGTDRADSGATANTAY